MDEEDSEVASLEHALDDKMRIDYFKGYISSVAQAIRYTSPSLRTCHVSVPQPVARESCFPAQIGADGGPGPVFPGPLPTTGH